jgi:hypothetical protein
MDFQKGKSERKKTCRSLAESSCHEGNAIIDMMKIAIQICNRYPDDSEFQNIKKQAETIQLTVYNLLGQLGTMALDD